MQDRPTFDELLAAVEGFLDDQVVARSEGALRYQGRVAANVIRIVRRELQLEDEGLGETRCDAPFQQAGGGTADKQEKVLRVRARSLVWGHRP